jgi:hypothetical protein
VPSALPHDVLVRIFSCLPRGELAVTPGRVSRAWAAAKAQAWAESAAEDEDDDENEEEYEYEDKEWCAPFLPQWYVLETYGAASSNIKLFLRSAAIKNGQMGIVRALYAAHPAAFGASECSTAARWGQLQILKFLHARGCPMSAFTSYMAASGNHMAVLQFCVEQGCPISSWTGACLRQTTPRSARLIAQIAPRFGLRQ